MKRHTGTRITITSPHQPISTRYTFERLSRRLLKTDVAEYILYEPCQFIVTGHVGVALDGRYLLYMADEAGYTVREALAAKLAMIVVDEETQ